MTDILLIIFAVFGYTAAGGAVFTRHNMIASRNCQHKVHWGEDSYNWCGHACLSLWLFGVFWFVGLGAATGALVGGDKTSRTERRHARELAEAEHKVKLAELARREDAELDLQLAAAKARDAREA